MTVAATEAIAGPYTGNDSASQFAFAFKVFADTDIRVVKTVIATGVESDLVLNSDYTVSRNADQDNDPGGTVTYIVAAVETALPSTLKLTIVGDFEYAQPTDLPNGGPYFASVVENALDRLTMLVKQLKEQMGRAVLVDVSSGDDPALLLDAIDQAVADAQAAQLAAETAQGLAEEWASKTDGIVDTTDYSSKAYAIGGTDITGLIGAAKEWATTVGAAVIAGYYSAKEWAVGTFTRGQAGGGSAKDWATYTGGTVDDTEYSAKKYSQDAAASAASIVKGIAAGNVLQADQAVTTVASASSVALTSTTQNNITGTTAVDTFTGTAGLTHHCKAVNALPLNHSAGLYILQTAASITLTAGDTFDVYMVTSNTCEIRNIAPPKASQAEMEAGTETKLRLMTPQGVGQAIAALGGVSITLGTATASTSGTAIDFTGIPDGAKRVTINCDSVSTSGTANYLFQVGDSGGIEPTGYLAADLQGGSSTAFTTGFGVQSASATNNFSGTLILTLLDASTNTWSAAGGGCRTNGGVVFGGSKSLSGTLDRVRITTSNGTDTFDSGKINITWE